MKSNLLAYRAMATIVGVLLIVLCLIGLPLHYGHLISDAAWLAEDTGRGWQIGSDISAYLGVAHGWLYMLFLIAAFLLARRAEWPINFSIVTLLMGTVPVLSFWSEHRATQRVKAEFADELV